MMIKKVKAMNNAIAGCIPYKNAGEVVQAY